MTLIKILGGAVRPTGDVAVEPAAARRSDRGAPARYQHRLQEFTLVPELSVADNVFLGREQGRPFLRRAAMARDVSRSSRARRRRTRRRRSPASRAHQQMVEIARARR